MPCGSSPCGNMCVCDIIRRDVRVVGVVSEHQALLLSHHLHNYVPQSVGPCLCCCCCVVSTKRSSSTPHQSSCCPPLFIPIKPLLSPPLSESGRHPLSRCGGVQTFGLAWKSIVIQRMGDRAKSSHYCSTVCILLWSDAPSAAPPPPPHTIGNHKGVFLLSQ